MRRYLNIVFNGGNIFARRSSGTHIPVLRAINSQIEIRKVIEVGTGIFSLKTFLDRKYFPKLTNLYSFETSKVWAEILRSKFQIKDKRWDCKIISENVKEVEKINFNAFDIDLAFIDGIPEQRKPIIKRLLAQNNKILFVFHDYDAEILLLGNEIETLFKYKYIYTPPIYNNTAILSNHIDVSKINWNIEWEEDYFKWI